MKVFYYEPFKDAGFTVAHWCWLLCLTRMLGYVFSSDAGLSVWLGCGNVCLTGELDILFERQEDWIDCSARMLVFFWS